MNINDLPANLGYEQLGVYYGTPEMIRNGSIDGNL